MQDRFFKPGERKARWVRCACGKTARLDLTATFGKSRVQIIPDRPEQYCPHLGRGFRGRRDYREYLAKSQDSDRPLQEYEGRTAVRRPLPEYKGPRSEVIVNRESMTDSQQRALAARISAEQGRR